MKRDHSDALQKAHDDLTEANRLQVEELVKKHNEERNNLIAESNKGNDEKWNALKTEYDILE